MVTQNRGIELALFLTLPATAAFIAAAGPIVSGLFERGHFDAADTLVTSWALAAFSIGLPSYVLVKVLTPGFYARADTRTPVRYAMISIGVRSEEHTSELQSLMRTSYAVFCLKKKN